MTLNRNPLVDSYLPSLNHPLMPVIQSLRLAILDADDAITERIQDRGQLIFQNAEAAAARQKEFVGLVREWGRA